jgi:hypothetical protein
MQQRSGRLVHLHRGARTFHSTRECPRWPRGKAGYTCTYDEVWDADVPPCWVCCPRTIFLPEGATERPIVYHGKPTCSELPRVYRRKRKPLPLLKMEWPAWEYNEVIESHEYRRCQKCLPSRRVLYPRGERKPKRHQRPRTAA